MGEGEEEQRRAAEPVSPGLPASDQLLVDGRFFQPVDGQTGLLDGGEDVADLMDRTVSAVLPARGGESDRRSGPSLHIRMHRRDDGPSLRLERFGYPMKKSSQILNMVYHEAGDDSIEGSRRKGQAFDRRLHPPGRDVGGGLPPGASQHTAREVDTDDGGPATHQPEVTARPAAQIQNATAFKRPYLRQQKRLIKEG